MSGSGYVDATLKAEGWNRPPVIEPDGEGELLEVAMGPHHPSTHGFPDGRRAGWERVIRLKPVFGYLHRNHEKLAEGMSYLASMRLPIGWTIYAR